MQLTIDDPRQLAGIEAATAAYNATLDAESEDYSPLTPQEYAEQRVSTVFNSWADQHKIGRITASTFILRFTPEEINTIKTAANTDSTVSEFLNRVESVDLVWLYSDEVKQGIAYCVSQGLLTQTRADEILSY